MAGAPLDARMLGDDDAALTAAEVPSDTLAALQLLRRQFPRGGLCDALPRLLLTSQLYCLVADRSAVDRELAALARSGVVRRFKLASGRDDFAFLFADDYAALVADARDHAAARGAHPHALAASFDAFATRVLPACPDAATVAAAALRALLRTPALPERAVDDALAALMSAGLVTRAMTPGADAFLFSAPGTVRCVALAARCLSCFHLRSEARAPPAGRLPARAAARARGAARGGGAQGAPPGAAR